MCYGGGCDHPSHYAEGGESGVHKQTKYPMGGEKGTSEAGDSARWSMAHKYSGNNPAAEREMGKAKEKHRGVISEMKSMPKPNLMAEGGEMEDEESHPMVKRLMMSRGGIVSNEESGESTDEPTMAKSDGNEFDDLALRDDLESSYTGENSGDEMGDSVESDDRKDIISRILKSRSKKDRMAVSGEGSTYGRRK